VNGNDSVLVTWIDLVVLNEKGGETKLTDLRFVEPRSNAVKTKGMTRKAVGTCSRGLQELQKSAQERSHPKDMRENTPLSHGGHMVIIMRLRRIGFAFGSLVTAVAFGKARWASWEAMFNGSEK
jgi:hypothetical protein